MDEHVYEIVVCAQCGEQVHHDADGNYDACARCSSFENETVRFRVSREAVLRQTSPHQAMVEGTIYFGCWQQSGHYFWRRGRDGTPITAKVRRDEAETLVPWGYKVDGGLFPESRGTIHEGEAHIVHKDGWTALAFPDRSVDSRPGSWSVFCIPGIVDAAEALIVARAAYPPIFARYTFPVVLTDAPA